MIVRWVEWLLAFRFRREWLVVQILPDGDLSICADRFLSRSAARRDAQRRNGSKSGKWTYARAARRPKVRSGGFAR